MPLHPDPVYPAASAFVVKLHRDGRPSAGIWQGRIESIATGRFNDFSSGAELLFWLGRMTTPNPSEESP